MQRSGCSRATSKQGTGHMSSKPDTYKPLRKAYSELSSQYDSRWKSYVDASIGQTVRRIPAMSPERILDIGCGTGVLLNVLGNQFPHAQLTGIDLSSEMLELARKKLGKSVELKQSPAERLPFQQSDFDLIVSTSIFHFIRSPEAALHEMFRVLRPSGQLVITDWCNDFFTMRMFDLYLRLFNKEHHRTYTSKSFGERVNQAGFTQWETDTYKIDRFWGLMTSVAQKTE